MKLYRGYNKDYSNWGIRPNQNYIWTTDDIDYALEYAKLFNNGGLVEFDVDDNQLNLANDYDGEELFGDEWYDFGGLIDADNDMIQVFIDNGFNSALLDNSGIDCYLLFDKKLIKSAKELPIEYDETVINEVLRIAGVQINESYDDYLEDNDDFWNFESGEYLDDTNVYPKEKLSAQFWNWFGNSKIKDEKGNPIIVYHSSNYDFDMFKRNPLDKDRIGGQVGYFFTNSLDAAEHWGDTGMIYDCFLKIENPIYLDGTQDFTTLESRNNLLLKAKQQGYDGAVIKQTDIGLPHYTDEYIAFYARQIKLIDNKTFKNNRNITETTKNKILKIDDSQQLNEGKYTVKGITFYEDPSIKWIKTQLNNGKELRIAIDGDLDEPYFGQWLVWDAYSANHNKAFQILGMYEEDSINLRLSKDAITYWGYSDNQINKLSQCEDIQKLYPNGYKLIKEW
jgi:hypothetical protein